MSFGRDLRALRLTRNLTQAQLADKALTSRVFISHLETEQLLPTPDLEKRLRKALNWTELEDEAFKILAKEPA
ncbi:unnamed protein product [marine sediment metagenome]|uniref:HTH cro/C1-type domain-containing protein n=1 Tax=marine sediment metagenome TaxID=412755 RepID=X1IK89_9ZZZZ